MGRPFRLAIMAENFHFPAWNAEAIQLLLEVPEVEISLLILEGQRRIKPPVSTPVPVSRLTRILKAIQDGSLLTKILKRFNWLGSKSLWPRYTRWQAKRGRIPSAKVVDLKELLSQVPVLVCNTQAKGVFAETFFPEDVATVRSYQLDAILKFGFNIVHGEILQAATHGVWSYHHDDHLLYRGGPPAFWEIFRSDPWTGAMLQRINEKLDDGLVLHKEYFRTRAQSYSHNLDQVWRYSSSWPALECLRLLGGCQLGQDQEQSRSQAPVFRVPKNSELLRTFAILARNKLANRWKGDQLAEHWGIGVGNKGPNIEPIRWLCSEPGTFCADPFVLQVQGRWYLFFERYDYSTKRGSIAVASTKDWQDFSPVEVVLENSNQHYSYPMIFEDQGSVFCVPEQSGQNEVALYELDDFPRGWRKVATPIENFAGLDPTVFFDGELWWLLVGGPDTQIDRLYAFFASSLQGPWRSHAANPIVTTRARRSRPAGRIYQVGQDRFRPAQYGHRYYGYGLLIYRIDELTPTSYRESLVRVHTPQPDWAFADGVHHLDLSGPFAIFDGKNQFRGRPPVAPPSATPLRLG